MELAMRPYSNKAKKVSWGNVPSIVPKSPPPCRKASRDPLRKYPLFKKYATTGALAGLLEDGIHDPVLDALEIMRKKNKLGSFSALDQYTTFFTALKKNYFDITTFFLENLSQEYLSMLISHGQFSFVTTLFHFPREQYHQFTTQCGNKVFIRLVDTVVEHETSLRNSLISRNYEPDKVDIFIDEIKTLRKNIVENDNITNPKLNV